MPSSKINQNNFTPTLKEVVVEAQASNQLIKTTISIKGSITDSTNIITIDSVAFSIPVKKKGQSREIPDVPSHKKINF